LAPVSVVAESSLSVAERWRSFETWVGTRASAVGLFLLALAVFALESFVLPAYPGRDMARYLETFFQLGYHVPVYPAVLNTRAPLAALGVALPLEAGGWAAEVWLALLYALSIVAWARVALTFGSRAAIATSALLLVYPGYGILFHQLASDSLFAAAFAGWAVLLTRAIQRPSIKAFLVAGAGLGALPLVRPANQVLLVMALLPLVLRAPWRDRLAWLAAFFIPAVIVAQSWKLFANLRYGDTVSLKPSTGLVALALVLVPLLLPSPWRGRAVVIVGLVVVATLAVSGLPGQSPAEYVRSVKLNESNQFLYRTFELDRIMAPDNGPASRRLADVVQQKLLTREPYRSYGVDVHEFFASGSDRVFGDLTGVASAADLAAATREAIRRHPGEFTSSIARTFWDQLANRSVYAPEAAAPSPSQTTATQTQGTQFIVVNGRRLPKPSEGQPIPASAIGPQLLTPGGTAQEVWTSPTEHSFVFSNPRDQQRFEKLGRDVGHLAARLPTRDGDASVVHRLNQASHRFPPLIAWLLIGVAGLALRRPRNALVAIAPSVAGLVVIGVSALVVPAVPEYAAPVSPAIVLLAAAGVFGVPVRRERPDAAKSWRPLVGLAVGVAAAVWAAKIYFDAIRSYFEGIAGAQHDLAVFLGAAGDVLDGTSPYVYRGDSTFAYPPFVAWLLAPLHPLSSSGAALVWLLLSLAAVAAALWLLELRDWRCYALAFVFIFTRSSLELGTIEPLLLLAVAAAWRWRDHLVETATAVGAAIALKLFLWPLAVWLALMRRGRAAVLAVAVAVLVAFVSWAPIGFAGVGGYPGTLRRLADDESTSSFSVVALGVRAHLPLVAARIIAVVVVIALLGAAAWVARDERRAPRDRDIATLTLCLAAALAGSPIVWIHYFLLLLIPLALTHPRLSPLWLVPFAYYPLGEAAWASGDARKLALALSTTLVILGASLLGVLKPDWFPRLQRSARARLRVSSG
jgi:Glycosyltransferase family 87/Dolichyl-phosphate-mannose-protein mannosyltransferase